MQMVKTYEFKNKFALCTLDIGQDPPEGGGQSPVTNAQRQMVDDGRLPFSVCAAVILVLSLGCYFAGYEVLTLVSGFFTP
jgi:hypothetical protein